MAVFCVLVAACGEPPSNEPAEAPASDAASPVQDVEAPEPGLRPFLPDARQRSTRAERFPHDAHAQISCSVCHEVPDGHGSHQGVGCAECHQASANARMVSLTPDQCQSCHHAADQPRSCETCHESRPALTSVQELFLEVWSAPRSRPLDFDHARHADLACASCHQALPALTPAEPCASCHASHHTARADCTACHVDPPAGAHDVQVHLTCSGSGCHRAPEVEAFATSRNVCLACHREQTDHEPGGDCIQCHRVRGEPTAWADWRHP